MTESSGSTGKSMAVFIFEMLTDPGAVPVGSQAISLGSSHAKAFRRYWDNGR